MAEEYKTSQLQREMHAFLNREEWNVMVTLTFTQVMTMEDIKRTSRRFLGRLNKRLYGKHTKRHVPVVIIVEGDIDGTGEHPERPHLHVLLNIDRSFEHARGVLRNVWRETHAVCGDPDTYCPDGKGWCGNIDSAKGRAKKVAYVLKQCSKDSYRVCQTNCVTAVSQSAANGRRSSPNINWKLCSAGFQ